jgi:Transcriptional regulator, AbiEi antitoxin/Protein of unknown function (DUF559)
VSALASKQEGRISARQLRACGLSSAGVAGWVARGWLHRRRRGVYAVGHVAGGEAAHLAEAVLRAGEGAALSHTTAAWWRKLLRYPSQRIHVSAPGRARSTRDVHVHHPEVVHREWHRGLPVTSVTQTLVQIAAMVSDAALRRALAVADRNGWLDSPSLTAALAKHPRGARGLRHALEHLMPQLTDTVSPLEDRFFLFCEQYGIPLPEPNYEIGGHVVDAVWPDAGVAVELDGRNEHGTPAAVVRDRRREMTVRGARFHVIRYGSEQVDHTPAKTARDLKIALAEGRARQAAKR